MTIVQVEPNMPERHFGAKIRPTDPREQAYAYARPAKAADWSRPIGATKEQRASIWDQRNQSSCTASVCEALETAARMQGRTVLDLSHKLVYWLAREVQGWVSRTDPNRCEDGGTYLADAAGVCLPGMAREDLWPYNDTHWQPPPAGVEADSPNQDLLIAHRAIYPGPGAADQVYDALSRGYTLQIGWVVRADMYDPGGRPYPRGLTPDPSGRHGYHASYLCRAFRDDDGTVYGVMPNSWGEGWNAGVERWNARECRPGEAVIPLTDWFERRNSPLFEARVLDLEPWAPQPEPEPEEPDMRRAIEIIRRREQEQYGAETFYANQGKHYEAAQCWWAGIQLGAAAEEIAQSFEAHPPRQLRRMPEV
jgi:hypothetical protein